MFRIIAIFIVAMVLLSTTVMAQNQSEYELQHQVAEVERQAMVAANMPLLDSEAEAFWKIYLEYRAAVKGMDNRRLNLLRRFAGSLEDLGDKQGDSLVTDALRLEAQRQSLRKRYFKKFARVLEGKRLFRYYQIETKLDAMKRFAWTSQIPLAPVP